MSGVQSAEAAELDSVLLYPLGLLCQTGAVSAHLTGSVTAGLQDLVVEAVAAVAEFPYLLQSGGGADELTESATVGGEGVLAVGGGNGPGAG